MLNYSQLTELVAAQRDKNSPQNIKNRLGRGLFPSTMPDELQAIINKWKVVSKSPYSDSFYDITNKSWGEDPHDFLRVADHWNFIPPSQHDGRVHAKTDKPVINNKQWALGRYDADAEMYHILQIWDYEKDEDNSRWKAKLELLDKVRIKDGATYIKRISKESEKRIMAVLVSLNYVGIKSHIVSDRKDAAGFRAFEDLCRNSAIDDADTSRILRAPENYPVDVVKYAQSHKRADRIYWIDKSNRKLAKSLDNA